MRSLELSGLAALAPSLSIKGRLVKNDLAALPRPQRVDHVAVLDDGQDFRLIDAVSLMAAAADAELLHAFVGPAVLELGVTLPGGAGLVFLPPQLCHEGRLGNAATLFLRPR